MLRTNQVDDTFMGDKIGKLKCDEMCWLVKSTHGAVLPSVRPPRVCLYKNELQYRRSANLLKTPVVTSASRGLG